MKTKLYYIPKKVYTFYKDEIIELSLFQFPNESKCDWLRFHGKSENNFTLYIGYFHKATKTFFLDSETYLTKKEAYDSYVKLLEQEIEDKNKQAFKIQMEALELIGDLNIFIETYEKEIEL
jgi:hypothetical protein